MNNFIVLNNIWIPYRSLLFSKLENINKVYYLADKEKVRKYKVNKLENEHIIKSIHFRNYFTQTQDYIISFIPFELFLCEKLIVFGWSYWQIITILFYRKIFNKKTIIFFESVSNDKLTFISKFKNLLKKTFLSKKFIYVSPSTKCDDYLKKIYPGIKVNRVDNYSIHNSEINTNLTIDKKIDFLYVGRNSKEKNTTLLINLYNKYRDRFSFMFIGDKFEGVHDKHQLGYTDNLSDYYKFSKYLLLPSIIEPYGMVAIEAFNLGCIPLISKNCGVSSELDENFILKDNFDLNIYFNNYSFYNEKLLNSSKKFTLKNTLNQMNDLTNEI